MSPDDKCEVNTPCGGGGGCCGTQAAPSEIEVHDLNDWRSGGIETPVGKVPRIKTSLTWRDVLGSWRARWGIGRMKYLIKPGLYAVGNPDADSPVLVSANYKLSFDRLRQELSGLNLWMMVVDTKGINVWCAAGKGTFGTAEVIERLRQVPLTDLVKHRSIILPQLSAPGVAAHEVQKQSGFKVRYGPVRSRDIREYLAAGMKATAQMRRVSFNTMERLILTPIELVAVIKPTLIVGAVLFGVQFFKNTQLSLMTLIGNTIGAWLPFIGAVITGTVLVPVLLPLIPGRSLALKGWLLGLIWAGGYIGWLAPNGNWLLNAAYLLMLPPIASYLALNFTGATTYTSLSGVVKEMRYAVPVSLISAGLGVGAYVASMVIRQ